MKKIAKLLLISMLTLTFFSCASGIQFSKMRDTIPKIDSNSGRIYIYRTTAFGAAIQPKVYINDEVVGKAVPKGVFYVDREPGNYVIKTSTEVKRTLSLTLDKGQIRYVRLKISMGFFVGHVYPELVDAETGESEIQDCRYIGKD